MSRDREKGKDSSPFDSKEMNLMVARVRSGSQMAKRHVVGLISDSNVESIEVVQPQDEYIPSLNDEIVLLIFARVPVFEMTNLCLVAKKYSNLITSGEIYDIRREVGVQEPLVVVYTGNGPLWWIVDPRIGHYKRLPPLPADVCFQLGDKETIAVGTHFLVNGRMVDGMATWRFELPLGRWFRGPSMISPRYLYGSATCGDFACVAGGLEAFSTVEIMDNVKKNNGEGMLKPKVLNSAEKYCPKTRTWSPLPKMKHGRKMCSGFYMDKRFYVIGGIDGEGNGLSCGEYFDFENNTWQRVPNMLSSPQPNFGSPPLTAVVNNELYLLDTTTNELKVYLKGSNSWMVLGKVPVTTEVNRGWGVAFKSLGNKLLLIGAQDSPARGRRIVISTCRLDPCGIGVHWQHVEPQGGDWGTFVYNCNVMVV